jgi:uncharacterized protein YozE (UPF0346 family)
MKLDTFYNWLLEQKYRDDGVGELAIFFLSSYNLPVKKTKRSLLAHLIGCQKDKIDVYNQAWQEYKQFRKLR